MIIKLKKKKSLINRVARVKVSVKVELAVLNREHGLAPHVQPNYPHDAEHKRQSVYTAQNHCER
jgi:hypothetical protein